MKLALVMLVGWVGSVAADPRGFGNPFVDAVAQKFFTAWTPARATLMKNGLDELLMPGGEFCGIPDAAMAGYPTDWSASPDGKTLLATTTAKLNAKTAKRLGMKAGNPEAVVNVALVFDSTGKLRIKPFDGGGCDRTNNKVTWSSDGKRAYIVAEQFPQGTMAPIGLHSSIIDLSTAAIMVESSFADPVPSPGLRHIASRVFDELQIDRETVWAEKNETYKNLAWTSDSSVTFCGGANAYRYELGPTPKLTKTGVCKP